MAADRIANLMQEHTALHGWAGARSERVASGFYKSHAMELRRP